jgi:hypothetical protein
VSGFEVPGGRSGKYQEQPAHECRRLVFAMPEYLWSDDEQQPMTT